MKKGLLLLPLALLLAGCKVDIDTEIPIAKVLSDGLHETKSVLSVEVASCTSYEDSRKPSNTLLEAQKTVASLFTGSQYKECFTKKFKSFATFDLPIVYGSPANGVVKDDGKIHILSTEGKHIYLDISPSLKKKINDIQDNKYSVATFNASDVSIYIKFINDQSNTISADIISAFAGNIPILFLPKYPIKKGDYLELRLSDVTTQLALWKDKAPQLPIVLQNVDLSGK